MAGHGTELEFDSSAHDDAVVVTPRGVLDVATATGLLDYLAKVGADQPRAILVDIAGLEIRLPAVAATLARAHAELAEWPGVPLVLVTPDRRSAELVARQRLERFVPVRRTVADAMASLGEPPPRLVDRVLLPNAPGSPDQARRFARDSCRLWDRPELADDAAAILGELVANCVAHTTSVCRVRVELRRGLLSVAAHDDSPATPPEPAAVEGGAGGLARVARTAAAWGCSPTWDGGKVVWATLRDARAVSAAPDGVQRLPR